MLKTETLTVPVGLRFTPSEIAEVDRRASEDGFATHAAYLRRLALLDARAHNARLAGADAA
jgi:hypothetical protein